MLGRRKKARGGPTDRRDLPRPPLWLNLLLLTSAVAALFFAARQRTEIDADYARILEKPSGSAELEQVKAQLAEMDMTKDALNRELDSRLSYLEKRKSGEFFLSIDTARKKMYLNFGNDTVRDADVHLGAPIRVEGPNGKTMSLAPLKGAFSVAGKAVNGLGKYVILLPNDYVIHSPPAPGGRFKGPKPGSFMVPEADLKAIWNRITPETRVYIF